MSLAGVAQYLRFLGRIPPEIAFGEGRPLPPKLAPEMHPEVQAFVTQYKVNSSQKRRELVALRHPAVLSVTPCVEGEAPLVLNAHKAEWL